MNTPAHVRLRQVVFYGLAGLLGLWMLVRAFMGVARLWGRGG